MIDVPDDAPRVYADQLSLFCECDAPVETDGADDCGECRKQLVR